MTHCQLLTSLKVSEDSGILLEWYVTQIVQRVIGESEEPVTFTISDNQTMLSEERPDEACALINIKASKELSMAQLELLKKEFYPVVKRFLNLSQDNVRVDYQKI